MRSVLSLALVALACATLLSPQSVTPVAGQFGVTTDLTGLVNNGTALRVAVIVNCVNDTLYPHPTLAPHTIPDITVCGMGIGAYDDWFRTYYTFERVLREKGGIPSSTGFKTPVQFVYFNIGGINYVSGNNTLLAEQYKNAAQNTVVLAQMLGAYGGYDLTTNTWDTVGPGASGAYIPPAYGGPLPPGGCAQCPIPYGSMARAYSMVDVPTSYAMTPGYLYGRFPVFITPAFGDTVPAASNNTIPMTLTETWYAACQMSKACIVIGQYLGTDEWMRCKKQIQSAGNPANPAQMVIKVPNECKKAYDPTLVADKRDTQRRFDMGFSALPSQSAMLSQLISWFKIKNARSAVIFFTRNPTYTVQILPSALAGLKANAIDLVLPLVYLPGDSAFTEEQAAAQAAAVVGANPDLVLFVADATDPAKDPLSALRLFRGFRDLDWTPKGFAIPGGANLFVSQNLNRDRMGDGGYVYGVTFMSWKLNSPAYDARDDDLENPNWEPFPSKPDGSAYSPEVLKEEYIKDWGETTPMSMADGYIQPQIAATLLVAITKLFYSAGTDDARLLAAAGTSISVPSVGGLLQFDGFGRIAQNEQYVTQHRRNGDLKLITPLNVGVNDVYPMPTWKERIAPTAGSASFLGTRDEKIAVAITTVVEVYLLVLLLGIWLYRSAAIIKSASPSLCALAIFGGMVCAASNYGVSLFATEAGCAADAWLLTTGFTMMFSALFAKTWRVYKIFQSGKLQVVKITNTTLYLIVALLVGVEVIVNIVWSASTGFPVRYVQVDSERPLYDYVECSYAAPGQSFVWFHLAFTSALILGGIVLTVLARNLPSMFNETPYLAASMYNCAVLLAFVLPIVASSVGGRNTTLMIRDYGLLLIVASTASILFVPKFMALWRGAGGKENPAAAKVGTAGGPTRNATQVTHSPNQPTQGNQTHGASHLSSPDSDVPKSALAPAAVDVRSPASSTGGKKVAFGDSKYKVTPMPGTPGSPTVQGSDAEVELRSLLAQSQAEIAELRRRLSFARKQPGGAGNGSAGSHRQNGGHGGSMSLVSSPISPSGTQVNVIPDALPAQQPQLQSGGLPNAANVSSSGEGSDAVVRIHPGVSSSE